jgi:hypothetical protein
VAWTAVLAEEGRPVETPEVATAAEEQIPQPAAALSPAAVGAGLLGAGVVAGATVATVARRAWRRQGERSHSSR